MSLREKKMMMQPRPSYNTIIRKWVEPLSELIFRVSFMVSKNVYLSIYKYRYSALTWLLLFFPVA